MSKSLMSLTFRPDPQTSDPQTLRPSDAILIKVIIIYSQFPKFI